MLKSSNAKYFEVAKRAVEIARTEFLNYRNKIGESPKYPDYITFSKFATCFDILGDIEFSMKLHEAALRGVNADKSDDAAAFRLVISANYLLTLEKNNNRQKVDEVIQKLKNYLDEYFSQVNTYSMKVPFENWKELLDCVEKNSADKIAVLEKMSRAILL